MLDQLKYTFSDIDKRKFCNYIFEITGGIPQRLHEYCLRLCYAIEDSDGDTSFRAVSYTHLNTAAWMPRTRK